LQVCEPDKFVNLVLDNEYMFLADNFKNDIHSLSIWKTTGELVMGGYFGLIIHDLFYKAGYTDDDKEKCMQEDFEKQQASINRLNELQETIKNIEEEIKKLKEKEE
jgi:Tfp pilus assembly protein PilO